MYLRLNQNLYIINKNQLLVFVIFLLPFFLCCCLILTKLPDGIDFKLTSMFIFICTGIFYLNYSVLIPQVLFRKKWVSYILYSFLLFISYSITISLVNISESTMMGSTLLSMNPLTAGFDTGVYENLNGVRNISFIDSFLLLYVFSLSSRLVQRWKKDEDYKKQLENEKSLMELNLLRNQINPHFIFNTLNSIYSLSISNRNGIPEAILRLSSILRYMLYECDRKMFKLEEELKVIEDYIQLQKLRLNDRVNVNYKIKTEPGEFFVEPLLIITLLENAFKYGADVNSDSCIDIDLCVLNGRLRLNIRNKILRQVTPNNDLCGIGLKNIKRRLNLIYPNQYYYNVKIEDSVYSACLELEL